MYWKILFLCFVAYFSIKSASSARILVVAPTPSYSHQVVFQSIWRELSLRGHQVVVLSPEPIKDNNLINLTEIDLSHSYEIMRQVNVVEVSGKTLNEMFEDYIPMFRELSKYQLSHPRVQDLIKDKNQRFDLLLVEPIFPIALGFVERFKCPYIMISSLDVPNFIHHSVGNPINPILYPDYMTPYVGDMSVYDRAMSLYYSLFMKYFNEKRLFPLSDEWIREYFGNGYPPLIDIYKNVSLIFVNTEPIFHSIRPHVPAVIPIGGGMHLRTPKPLPMALQNYLDSATDGCIYFSLGTNVKSKDLNENTRQTILETFSELPYKILWKFELDELKEKPDNVYISKWFPQQDIFRHPNIKLFITQGGLQSMEEAVYNQIPIVVMPFFADQPLNAQRMVDKGIAVSLDYKTLDKATFKNAILEVINNPKYRKNVETLATLIKDQPTTGLERAVWWTEYVLRHNGAQHLRGPSLNVPLYQEFLLDIFGACFVILIVVIWLLVVITKILIKIKKYLTIRKKEKDA